MNPVPPPAGAGAAAAPELEAARLYECYRKRILAFALGRLRTREDAEDAVQTTFLYAFRSLRRGIVPNHELAWLLTIAQNVCRTRARSASRRGRHEQVADPSTLEAVSAALPPVRDELASLQQALGGMPATQQRAILLREWRGLSYQEIGDDLGLSQSAVETLLFRARRTLAVRLQKALQTLLGPLGLARSLFGGGAAKVAATVVVASGTVVTLPPLHRDLERDRLAARQGAAVSEGQSSTAVGSLIAPRSSQVSERAAARAVRPAKLRRDRPAMPVAGDEAGPTRGGPSLPPATPAGPEAPGDPASPTPAAPSSGGQPGPAAPVVASVSPGKPGASIAANPPGVSIDATVSTSEPASATPAVDTNASVTTPAGSAEVGATVEPGSPDPVTVTVNTALPPPPPILP